MKTYHIFPLFMIFLFTGCLKEEKINVTARIQVCLPEGFEKISPEGIQVKLYSTISGLTYTSTCDVSGIASFNVEYGFYEAVAQHRKGGGNTIDIFNGKTDRVALTRGTPSDGLYKIFLSHVRLQKLIIKEIYYASCKKDDGSNYMGGKDSYVSIYNNSDETVYLDSLCIGTVNPITSASPSNFINHPDFKDLMPIFMMAWQFPGAGQDHPLTPGKEVVLALNAINHLQISSRSIDLSTANFAFYDKDLTGLSVPAPGVEWLKMFWKNNGTAYTLTTTGPAIVLFRIPTSVAPNATVYADNEDNIKRDPTAKPSSSMKFLIIHKDWVIDGVECVMSASKANKRLINSVDAGFVYIETGNLGLSVSRKIAEVVDGRTVYMDSNNSTEDFEVVPNTFKNR